MKQSELCEKTGIPKSAMSQYLSGAFRPKQERTYLIAQALQTTPEYLLGFTDSMEIPDAPLGIVDGLRNSSEKIAHNMKLMRKSRKMSQEELAKLANLPLKTVERYEIGIYPPDIDDLLPIADALGISVAALTGISIPVYELSEEGLAFFKHNSPTGEEMGMGYPSPTDEIANKIYHRVLKMTPQQKQKAWEIIKMIFDDSE